eukprot:Nk52_evm17s355 gene=Nk52_evmTU17s355
MTVIKDDCKYDSIFQSQLNQLKEKTLVIPYKHIRLRISEWIKKLCEPCFLSFWRKNRNCYAQLLLAQLSGSSSWANSDRILSEPFNKRPAQAPLPLLPQYLLVNVSQHQLPSKGAAIKTLLSEKAVVEQEIEKDKQRLEKGNESKDFVFSFEVEEKKGSEAYSDEGNIGNWNGEVPPWVEALLNTSSHSNNSAFCDVQESQLDQSFDEKPSREYHLDHHRQNRDSNHNNRNSQSPSSKYSANERCLFSCRKSPSPVRHKKRLSPKHSQHPTSRPTVKKSDRNEMLDCSGLSNISFQDGNGDEEAFNESYFNKSHIEEMEELTEKFEKEIGALKKNLAEKERECDQIQSIYGGKLPKGSGGLATESPELSEPELDKAVTFSNKENASADARKDEKVECIVKQSLSKAKKVHKQEIQRLQEENIKKYQRLQVETSQKVKDIESEYMSTINEMHHSLCCVAEELEECKRECADLNGRLEDRNRVVHDFEEKILALLEDKKCLELNINKLGEEYEYRIERMEEEKEHYLQTVDDSYKCKLNREIEMAVEASNSRDLLQHETSLNKLHQEYNERIARIQQEHILQNNNHHGEIERLKRELQTLQQKLREANEARSGIIQSQSEENNYQTLQPESKYSEANIQRQQSNESFGLKVQQLQAELKSCQQQLSFKETEHTQALERIKYEHGLKLESLKHEHHVESQKLTLNAEKEKSVVVEREKKYDSILKQKQSEIDDLYSQNASLEKELKSSRSSLETQMETWKQQHEIEMRELLDRVDRREYEYEEEQHHSAKIISNLEGALVEMRDFVRQLEGKEAKRKKEEDEQIREYDQRLGRLQWKYEQLELQLHAEEKEKSALLQKLRESDFEMQKKMSSVRLEYENQMKGLLPSVAQEDMEHTITSLQGQVKSLRRALRQATNDK